MSELYTKVGSISLWNGKSDSERAPKLRGEIEIDGKKYGVALWDFDGENTATGPVLKGSVEIRNND